MTTATTEKILIVHFKNRFSRLEQETYCGEPMVGSAMDADIVRYCGECMRIQNQMDTSPWDRYIS